MRGRELTFSYPTSLRCDSWLRLLSSVVSSDLYLAVEVRPASHVLQVLSA